MYEGGESILVYAVLAQVTRSGWIRKFGVTQTRSIGVRNIRIYVHTYRKRAEEILSTSPRNFKPHEGTKDLRFRRFSITTR